MAILLVYSSSTHVDLFKNFKCILVKYQIPYEEIFLFEFDNINRLCNVFDQSMIDYKVNSLLKYIRFIFFYNNRKKSLLNFFNISSIKKTFIANDVGFVEKMIIEASREFGVKTYLVQDGLVDINSRNSLVHSFLYGISKILTTINLRQFGFNRYGAYKVDFVLSIGNLSESYFEQVKDINTSIINFGYFRFIASNVIQDKESINLYRNNNDYIYYLGGFEISKSLISKNNSDFENLRLIYDLLVKTNSQNKLYIVIHPASRQEDVRRILQNNSIFNFHIIDKSRALLYINAKHFTYSSSVIFELIYQNINAFIIDKNLTSDFSLLYNPCKLGSSLDQMSFLLNDSMLIANYNLRIRKIMKSEFTELTIDNLENLLKNS